MSNLAELCEDIGVHHSWTCTNCRKWVGDLEVGCPDCGESDKCRLANPKITYWITDGIGFKLRFDGREMERKRAYRIYERLCESGEKNIKSLRAEDAHLGNRAYISYVQAEKALAQYKQDQQDLGVEDFFEDVKHHDR